MIKWLARPADYLSVWRDMQAYTDQRSAETPDEIWLCEHAPVYTLGQAGLPEHVLNPGAIPWSSAIAAAVSPIMARAR